MLSRTSHSGGTGVTTLSVVDNFVVWYQRGKMPDEILWLPLLSSLICVILKAGATWFKQPFNFRGMPSGHAAVMATLLTILAFRMPNSKDVLGVAIAFSALYISDIFLFYNYAPRALDGLPLGHSFAEVIVGACVGISVAIVHRVYVKKQSSYSEHLTA